MGAGDLHRRDSRLVGLGICNADMRGPNRRKPAEARLHLGLGDAPNYTISDDFGLCVSSDKLNPLVEFCDKHYLDFSGYPSWHSEMTFDPPPAEPVPLHRPIEP